MTDGSMDAWAVAVPGPIDSHPLRHIRRAIPDPGPGQVRVHVRVCGVCRTDLHLAEGDLAPRRDLVVPGHEVVGVVDAHGDGAQRFATGDRVGVPWLARSCGVCRFCLHKQENLIAPLFTGWDIDGGYAEYVIVEEAFAYPLPEAFGDEEAAPLLCAGIIGSPRPPPMATYPPGAGWVIYGFGGIGPPDRPDRCWLEGATVHVITRSPEARRLALDLGAGQRRRPTTRYLARPNLSTPPSCSLRWAPWCRRPLRPSSAAGPWPLPASICRTSPTELPEAPLPGTVPLQRDGQHPPRRTRVLGGRGPHPHPGGLGGVPSRPGRPGRGRPGR